MHTHIFLYCTKSKRLSFLVVLGMSFFFLFANSVLLLLEIHFVFLWKRNANRFSLFPSLYTIIRQIYLLYNFHIGQHPKQRQINTSIQEYWEDAIHSLHSHRVKIVRCVRSWLNLIYGNSHELRSLTICLFFFLYFV